MSGQVKRFKSLKIGLKELEPFVRNIGMLPREAWANWIVCAVGNFAEGDDRFTFSTDPDGGDGIIYNTATETPYPTEHVLVPRQAGGEGADAGDLILEAIKQKQNKGGAAYARGKTIVFLNAGAGEWSPDSVAGRLPKPLDFAAVWIVALHDPGEYVYNVSQLDLSEGLAPVWRLRIAKDFDTWQVEQIR